MKITVFSAGESREGKPDELKDLLVSAASSIWVDMTGPDQEDVDVLHNIFNFHPLAIEDTRNIKQRPKLEEYPGHLFLIVNSIVPLSADSNPLGQSGIFHHLDFHEIDIFVGNNYVVTVHGDQEAVIGEAVRRLKTMRATVPVTSSYLLYIVLDAIVDNYFPVMDLIEVEIDKLEGIILDKPNQSTLNRVFELKSMLIDMWRAVWPQRDVLSRLLQPHILNLEDKDTTRFYLRDVSDHLLWIADMVATYRDTLTTIIDLYMSAVSNRLNRVVNRLTVITLGFGMLAVITGFYGMNFENTWPPFNERLGVPFVLILIGIVTAIILYVLRRMDVY